MGEPARPTQADPDLTHAEQLAEEATPDAMVWHCGRRAMLVLSRLLGR